MIDAYASEAHYADHLEPVWFGLGPSNRGQLYVASEPLARRTSPASGSSAVGVPRGEGAPVLVASGKDLLTVTGRSSRRCILMEHGAGQTYYGDQGHPVNHVAFAGGPDRERVDLFLCPNEEATTLNRCAYPKAKAVTIGSPHLDATLATGTLPHSYFENGPVIAFAFHWRSTMIAEAGSAWDEYRPWIERLARSGAYTRRMIGTGHPRIYGELEGQFERWGIMPCPDWHEVARLADVLVADNSSVMYEWAALDRPVLALNSRRWRREVHHGLRFWNAVPGIECDVPGQLADRLLVAINDGEDGPERRARAVQAAYSGLNDGKASQRAVAAIKERYA